MIRTTIEERKGDYHPKLRTGEIMVGVERSTQSGIVKGMTGGVSEAEITEVRSIADVSDGDQEIHETKAINTENILLDVMHDGLDRKIKTTGTPDGFPLSPLPTPRIAPKILLHIHTRKANAPSSHCPHNRRPTPATLPWRLSNLPLPWRSRSPISLLAVSLPPKRTRLQELQ